MVEYRSCKPKVTGSSPVGGSLLKLECFPFFMSKNNNFVDQAFTVIADVLLKVLPISNREKSAFTYYREGMDVQEEGEYSEALYNYYEALRLEVDPYDRSFIYYNLAIVYTRIGDYDRALKYYFQTLEIQPSIPQALNNVAVIFHRRGEQSIENGDLTKANIFFDKAADYWREAVRILPNKYIAAENWLKMTGRNDKF